MSFSFKSTNQILDFEPIKRHIYCSKREICFCNQPAFSLNSQSRTGNDNPTKKPQLPVLIRSSNNDLGEVSVAVDEM